MSRNVHFEIQASRPQAMMDFHGSLFGWTFKQWQDHDYRLIDTGSGKPGIGGGLLPRSEIEVSGDMAYCRTRLSVPRAHWTAAPAANAAAIPCPSCAKAAMAPGC